MLNPQQFRPLYHGTRATNVDQILHEGLRHTAQGVNPAGWPMLTTSREQARRYTPSGDSAVLQIDIPEGERDELLWPGRDHDAYDFPATAHGVKATIPSKYIKRVE